MPTNYNRLGGETSPYLLQHADNPVAWQPWDENALQAARDADKPILLSIGYSACHWCHVMAHESFEDPATAAQMNDAFVNIKVDREERPDLDKIYQTAHQLLTGRPGGWPLTIFLTPDGRVPFFAGTYFPPERRHGLPAFGELLEGIAHAYREQHAEIEQQNLRLVEALESLATPAAAPGEPDPGLLQAARDHLVGSYDTRHGGFGSAPKFPHPSSLERLLRHAHANDDAEAGEAALGSLAHMAEGGIFDQLGGGFCRYSVDAVWMIPHFEKMLYDNGPLLALCAEAWAVTGDPLFRRAAELTAGWAMREMQSPEGAYYATQDADSEGEEGLFYVWQREEVQALLGDDYPLFARRFGLDRAANFEGRWHLHTFADLEALAADFALEREQVEAVLERCRQQLFEARSKRVAPGRDEKVLSAWNGLMVRGMAVAGRILGRDDWLDSAQRAVDFLRSRMWRDGRLLAAWKDGHGHLPGYLDDHAFLLDALLELLRARWRDADLAFAVDLAEALLGHFEDRERGGFYFTADDHEALIQRPRPLADEATPSGNGVAARSLARLGHLLGEGRYLQAAERSLRAAWPAVTDAPYAYPSLLDAAEEWFRPPELLVLRGEPAATTEALARLNAAYAPDRFAIAIPGDRDDLPGLLAQRPARGRFTAYRCRGTVCDAPLESPQALFDAATA